VDVGTTDKLNVILVCIDIIQKLACVIFVPKLLNILIVIIEPWENVHTNNKLFGVLRFAIIFHKSIKPDQLLLSFFKHTMILSIEEHGV